MTDGLGLFDESRGSLHDDDHYDDHDDRSRGRRKRRRGPVVWVVGVLVVALIGAGAWYGLKQIIGIGGFEDYEGAGESDVVVEVKPGQGTGDIGATLKSKDVVASPRAFVSAGDDQPKVKSIQPGYYVLKTKMSGKAAADRIVDPASRVGHLQIRAGTQLDDITLPDKKVTQGIFSLMAKASAAKLNGKDVGVSADELRKAAETADLAQLGVPQWAIPDASKAEPKRRLEGLITPGVYDVQPGWTAQELLKKVVSDSAVTLGSWGMPKVAEPTGYTPYQVLVMASLIEREGIEKDFKKISRVTYKRLEVDMPLQYDSTINYPLDKPVVTTERSVRETPGPYNTYLNRGLTPTPISAPSKKALEAAVAPEPGSWLYFVKCEKDGTTCFAETITQHEQNKADARARGAY